MNILVTTVVGAKPSASIEAIQGLDVGGHAGSSSGHRQTSPFAGPGGSGPASWAPRPGARQTAERASKVILARLRVDILTGDDCRSDLIQPALSIDLPVKVASVLFAPSLR